MVGEAESKTAAATAGRSRRGPATRDGVAMLMAALLAGCGGGGAGAPAPVPAAPPSAQVPPAPPPPGPPTPDAPPPVSADWRVPATAYDVAAEVAAIRAHPGYGAQFSAGGHPQAPTGLALPAGPAAQCLANTVTVTSLAQFNTEAAGACKRIVLAPSSTPYVGAARITGQDIEAVFTGTRVSPADDSFGLSVVLDARRIRTVGGTFDNAYTVGGYRRNEATGMAEQNHVEDVHLYGASFTGKYTQGTSSTYYGDGVTVSAHRLLVERLSVRSANGGLFVEGGSSNIILANSNLVVPKLARHENPVRINGADLIAVLDSRLRTEWGPGQSGPIKHTWRMHAAYDGAGTPGGRIIVRNVQSEGGGAMAQYPGVEGPNRQSAFIAVQGWRYYRGPLVEGNNIASFPHRNLDPASAFNGSVMNAAVWMDDNRVFDDGAAAGSAVMTSNVPPGPVTRTTYAPYGVPPSWTFR